MNKIESMSGTFEEGCVMAIRESSALSVFLFAEIFVPLFLFNFNLTPCSSLHSG